MMKDEGVPLANLVDSNIDRSGPRGSGEFRYIDIGSINRTSKRLIDVVTLPIAKAPSRAKQKLKADDVLVSMTRPNLNAVAMVPHDLDGAIGSTGFHVLRAKHADAKFLFYAVQTQKFIESMCLKVQGALYPAVRPVDISSFCIPPFSLAHQRRIVAKIEELFSELEAGEESLRTARRQLATYRQSLLKQAFQGHLTAKWREETKTPHEWRTATLGNIAQVTGGLTKNSKRDSLPRQIPYLRVANVYANELRLDEIKDIGVTADEAEKVRLAKGDLLIVEGNGSLDQIGRVAAWDGSISNCGHQNHLIRARCNPIAHHTFVLMFLLSPQGRDLIVKQAASTSGLHTLSVSKVQRLEVPLCPLPEQHEIVRLLDEQFEVIERNERAIDAALKRSEALRQSILHRAFTGRLVPQNPADEPATQLLTRIREERAPARQKKSARSA